MDSEVVYESFVWNTTKEERNLQQHGVSFKTASDAFFDPHRMILTDELHSRHEERYFCLGVVKGRVLTVRFTRREDKIRIIGAGYWRKGKKIYETQNQS